MKSCNIFEGQMVKGKGHKVM